MDHLVVPGRKDLCCMVTATEDHFGVIVVRYDRDPGCWQRAGPWDSEAEVVVGRGSTSDPGVFVVAAFSSCTFSVSLAGRADGSISLGR